MKSMLIRMIATCSALAVHGVLQAAPSPAGEPVYLAQPWFHRGPDVNVLTTPANVTVAVDNEGRYLTDESIGGKNNRFARLALDSLQSSGGEYIVAMRKAAYEGSFSYTYYRVSQGGKILTTSALAEVVKAGASPLPELGFCFDSDVRHGVPGLLLFPKAGLAVLRGRSTNDSQMFSVVPFGADAAAVPFGGKDHVELGFEAPAANAKRGGNVPTAVMADPDGTGFWAISSIKNGKISVAHAKPGLKPDGGRSLNMSAIIPVGEAAKEAFESGVASNEALFLLLSRGDDSIGGVAAERRLVRVGLVDGHVTDTLIPIKHYINEAALAICGDRIIVYAGCGMTTCDGRTLKPLWDKETAVLSDNSPKGYQIYRITANPKGSQLAVALATAYRRPDEPTRVVMLDTAGTIQKPWVLKPGSIDNLEFTSDGGLLVFSSAFTAKLGGATLVKGNEAASIAQADKNAAPDPATKPAAPSPAKPAPPPAALVQTPLRDRHKLWFDKPGGVFLPLGNGIMAAMMYGETDTAKAILDLDSAWDGSDTKHGTFQSLGEVNFRLGHDPKTVTNFRRELDLRTGLFTMTYQSNGVTYKREAFCSYPSGLLAIRFTADKPGSLSGQLELTSRQKAAFTKGKDGLGFSGQKSNGQKFACVMRVNAQGGEVLPEAGKDGVTDTSSQRGGRRTESSEEYKAILLKGCDSVTLYVAGDTDYAMDPAKQFKSADPQQKIAPHLAAIGRMTFDKMKDESMADVARLFDRCTLDLATSAPDAESLPSDKRRNSYKTRMYQNDAPDLGFQTLAFDAARYMMIACSRPGSLPANLQGHWNEGNGAEWTGDYHTDINVEMNYWFVEPANLAECAIPLFDYIESQIPYWRKKSKAVFGDKVRGWTVEYMNNIFGGGTDMNYPPGGAWLSWHYDQHFEFGQEKDFLRNRAYPVLKDLAEHWQDLLIKRPDGQLTTPRTSSPEHGPFQYGIAQDRQMVYDLLTNYQSAAARLQCDAGFSKQVEALRTHIVPPQIGRWGQVQEWEADEDSRYCTHRHMMHIFAAFPGRAINPLETPELNAAAIRSLEARGEGATGWSKAWRVSMYARLRRPDLAYRALSTVVAGFHDNLIWEGKKQIDAPCGYASGVCELLLQSQTPLDGIGSRYVIELLPALPADWPAGSVKGLRARGGYEVDIDWRDGMLTRATIRNVAGATGECTVRYRGVTTKITVPRGESRPFAGGAGK